MCKEVLEVIPVTEANQRAKNWPIDYWLTRNYENRKVGYVAICACERCKYWAKTKKEARKRIEENKY